MNAHNLVCIGRERGSDETVHATFVSTVLHIDWERIQAHLQYRRGIIEDHLEERHDGDGDRGRLIYLS